MEGTAATDLAPLRDLPRLEKLRIAQQPADEWSILGELAALKDLVLDMIYADLDLSWLAVTPALRSIELSECSGGVTLATFDHRQEPLAWLIVDASSDPDLRHVGGVGQLVIARSGARLLSLATTRCHELSLVADDAEFVDLPRAAEAVNILYCQQLRTIRNAAECVGLKQMTIAASPGVTKAELWDQFPNLRAVWLATDPFQPKVKLADVPGVEVSVVANRALLPLPDRVRRLLARSESECPSG